MSAQRRARLERIAAATARAPAGLPAVVREDLGIDLSARYAGIGIPHPFGKASGQLSWTEPQIAADAEQGIAFIVLKTVIAEDAGGSRSMAEWTVTESRMRVERRISADGREGWTITWKGRGWPGSLGEYLGFFEQALGIAGAHGVPVIPSVKYHLPGAAAEPFRDGEYHHTTGALLDVWARRGPGGAMPLEKDFSPTLAGDRRAADRETILAWVRAVPGLIERAAPGRVTLGVKLMNALFDDDFQVDMLRAAAAAHPAPAFWNTPCAAAAAGSSIRSFSFRCPSTPPAAAGAPRAHCTRCCCTRWKGWSRGSGI
jgi:hypothetical protein